MAILTMKVMNGRKITTVRDSTHYITVIRPIKPTPMSSEDHGNIMASLGIRRAL